MIRVFSAGAALALVLAASVRAHPAAAQAGDVRGILFSAQVLDSGEALLLPVATLLPDGFGRPDAAQPGPFSERWMSAGRRYDMLSAGERIGEVTLSGADVAGCYGLHAFGTIQVHAPLDEERQGLAGDGIPEQRNAPWLRAVTAEEKRELDRMAAALFDAHGIDVAARPESDTAVAALVVHPNARPVLVGSYTRETTEGIWRKAALLVVAEDGENGYRPAYAWFNEGIEADVQSRTLVDAADLDGDGMPELVVRNKYYESWTHAIFSRFPEGWIERYRGGESGC